MALIKQWRLWVFRDVLGEEIVLSSVNGRRVPLWVARLARAYTTWRYRGKRDAKPECPCDVCSGEGVVSCEPVPCCHGGHTCSACAGKGYLS